MKKHIAPVLVIAAAFGADFFTKQLAVKYLGYYKTIDFFGGFIRLDLTYNRGGVFGIMQGHQSFFLIVSCLVLAVMVVYYFYEKAMPWLFHISMALIIAGALGNIFDRLVPGRTGVVDFLSVGVDGVYRWPTFNIADSVIVVGALLLVFVVYRQDKKGLEEKDSSQ
jgi:signal peptidase II